MVVEKMAKGSELGRKLVVYRAKEAAVKEAILIIRTSPSLTIDETIKATRMLAKTEFRNQWKANRLAKFAQTGSV